MSDPTPIPDPPQLTHPRQLIREKVAALLLDATNAGKRVWPSRTRHFEARRLPAIGIYTLEDAATVADASPRRYDRTVTVVVEILATADDELDNVLDVLAAQVEAVLLADKTLGGVADDSAMGKTSIGFAAADEGEQPFACLAMEFEADYTTRPGLVDAATLDAFKTAHFDWDLGSPDPDGPDGVIDAEDTATLEQED